MEIYARTPDQRQRKQAGIRSPTRTPTRPESPRREGEWGRERSREFGLPTQSTGAACLAFNGLFTLDCLMKESLHSFIRFIHSFNSFASLLDSFMRRRAFLCFYCLCLFAAALLFSTSSVLSAISTFSFYFFLRLLN